MSEFKMDYKIIQNKMIAAVISIEDHDIKVTVNDGYEQLASVLRALLRCRNFKYPVLNRQDSGTIKLAYDSVTINDNRWPSALAYALGPAYAIVLAGDDIHDT